MPTSENTNRVLRQTESSRALRRKARREMYIALSLVVGLTVFSSIMEWELVEVLYEYTREHEEFELDEWLLGAVWLGLVAVFYGIRRVRDINRLNRHVAKYAYFDPITKLPNRVLGMERLTQMVSDSERHSKQVAVLFLDFNNFKMVNDTHGHAIGDLLIKSVGHRLKKVARCEDTVARLGGDEFLILLENVESADSVRLFIKRILATQDIPHIMANVELHIQFSIGVAMYPHDGISPENLLKAADVAMYQAKEDKERSFHFYSEDMEFHLKQRYVIELGLKHAIENNEFHLVYQPEVSCKTGQVQAFEALIRWIHKGENIPPDTFIEIAEECGMILELGQWVLSQACHEAVCWKDQSVNVAVNISVRQMQSEEFVEQVKQVLAVTGLSPSRLELEITETAIMVDFAATQDALNQLRSLGIKISIDDFGTGYSSLSRLRDLHVDKLKIDRSFVADIEEVHSSSKVMRGIVSLAHSMDLEVIAEGIETIEQQETLQSLDCELMQGFYISRPMTADRVNGFITDISNCNVEHTSE